RAPGRPAARARTPEPSAAAARTQGHELAERRALRETDRLRLLAAPAAPVRRRPRRPGRLAAALRVLRGYRGARPAVVRAPRRAPAPQPRASGRRPSGRRRPAGA